MKHAHRMQVVDEAIIPSINRMIGENPGTISLGQGVVFYPPPPQAMEYAKEQMAVSQHNPHFYGDVAGLAELQHAIAIKLKNKNGISADEKRAIFVTAGANMAFNALVLAICDPGDEVILLLPYYFNHEMTITMCGARAKCVVTDDNYQPVVERIEQAITKKTRAVVTISPNNPSGAVYSQATLTDINALCASHNIYHISDEAYEDFVFEKDKHFSPASLANATDHTLSLFSMSKSYGFASWRIGYMLVPKTLCEALIKVQDNILICPPIISQYAAIACLEQGENCVAQGIRRVDENRKLCLAALKPLIDKGVISQPPAQGAMYLFVRLNTDIDDKVIAQQLIQDFRVAAIPGSAFGNLGGPTLRISYGALGREDLRTGMGRLVEGLQSLLVQ